MAYGKFKYLTIRMDLIRYVKFNDEPLEIEFHLSKSSVNVINMVTAHTDGFCTTSAPYDDSSDEEILTCQCTQKEYELVSEALINGAGFNIG
jgi:hypothetical protein